MEAFPPVLGALSARRGVTARATSLGRVRPLCRDELADLRGQRSVRPREFLQDREMILTGQAPDPAREPRAGPRRREFLGLAPKLWKLAAAVRNDERTRGLLQAEHWAVAARCGLIELELVVHIAQTNRLKIEDSADGKRALHSRSRQAHGGEVPARRPARNVKP